MTATELQSSASAAPNDRAARLAAWRRQRRARGLVLLVLGSILMVGGGLYAGVQQYPGRSGDPMDGIWVGSVGTLGVVVGAVWLRAAYTGPFPRELAPEDDA